MNANLRNFALWVIIVLLVLALFTLFQSPSQRQASQDISFSQLLTEVDAGRVRDVVIQGQEIHGTFTDLKPFSTYAPNDPTLVQRLYGKGVTITSMTTIIGFGTMIFASHRGISSLGFVLATGILMTMLSCWTVVPAWLELRRRRAVRKVAAGGAATS